MPKKCPPVWGGTGQDPSPDAGRDRFLGDIPLHQPVHAGNFSYVPNEMPLEIRRVVLPISLWGTWWWAFLPQNVS